MTTVYLWEACGSRCHVCGVTRGSEKHALEMAAKALRSSDAVSVLVEQARTALDAATLQDGYQRTGHVWVGRITRPGGRISWHEHTIGDAAQPRPRIGDTQQPPGGICKTPSASCPECEKFPAVSPVFG
jgi:hypothetical protein